MKILINISRCVQSRKAARRKKRDARPEWERPRRQQTAMTCAFRVYRMEWWHWCLCVSAKKVNDMRKSRNQAPEQVYILAWIIYTHTHTTRMRALIACVHRQSATIYKMPSAPLSYLEYNIPGISTSQIMAAIHAHDRRCPPLSRSRMQLSSHKI